MAFIRKKQTKVRTCYQVVRTYRQDGKVRQQVLASLSHNPTISEAIAWIESIIQGSAWLLTGYGAADAKKRMAAWRERIATLERIRQETGLS